MELSELEAFGERVRLIRKHFKMSQKDFAEKLGIVAPYLSDIENGKGKPQVAFFHHMLQVFHVNQNFLICGCGEMFNATPGALMDESGFTFREIVDNRQLFWLVEHSYLFRMYVLSMSNVFFMNNSGIIKTSVESSQNKKKPRRSIDE